MNTKVDPLKIIQGGISPGMIILCDMDGTLIDTDYANYMAYMCAVREVTKIENIVEFSPRERLNRESLRKRLPHLTDDQLESIVALKSRYFSKHLPETRVNNQIADLLRRCGNTNRAVLVTNCREYRAVETLKYHGLFELFSRLIFREQIVESGVLNKYASALLLLEVKPDDVIVFERDPVDVEMAMLAGIPKENIFSTACLEVYYGKIPHL